MHNYLLVWQHSNSQYFTKVMPNFWLNGIETFLFFQASNGLERLDTLCTFYMFAFGEL